MQVWVEDGAQANPAAVVRVKRQGGLFWIMISVGTDHGTSIDSSWLPLHADVAAGEAFWLALSWKAAKGPGSEDSVLSLDLRHRDGSPMLAIDLAGVDNDSHRVGRIRIGVLGSQGLGSGWSAMLLDDLAITP